MSAMAHAPLISVVTPVFNGGPFLAECIESVLAQTYAAFEHVILDNASTDETGPIALGFACRDRRIRVHRNDRTVGVIHNWNRALDRISSKSVYCKILHADDTITPDCLEKMAGLAARHPSVGIVGSLRRRGDAIECQGLPADREVFPGADVARLFLRGDVFALAPSSGLIRSDLVRARRPFYPTEYLHADLAAYFELLAKTDFGFVAEVLSFSRVHANSITATVAERKQTLLRDWLLMLQRYGPRYFPADELAATERAFLGRYYRLLVRGFFAGRDRGFFDYHLGGLRQAGRMPTATDLCRAAVAELGAAIAQPRKALRHFGAGARR